MALDSYDNLKAALIRLDGSDRITDILDDCIDLAETEMFANDQAVLKVRDLEATTESTLSTSSRFVALPTRYISMRGVKLRLPGSDADIKFSTPESMQSYSASGRPKFFTVTTQLEFDRVPDSAYTIELKYFAKPAPIDATTTTNAILTAYPNIYLFGSLYAVKLFNGEEQLADFYYSKFISAIKGANKLNKSGAYGPAPTMKFEGPTP